MTDSDLTIVAHDPDNFKREVYNLGTDPAETTNLFSDRPDGTAWLRAVLEAWGASVEAGAAGTNCLGCDFDVRESQPSR